MDASLPSLLLGIAGLLLASVLASKASSRFGVPALLLFLAVGMLAGSDGPGGIAFDYPQLAQSLGIVALAFILFSGGLDTRWEDVRPVLSPGLALATVGVHHGRTHRAGSRDGSRLASRARPSVGSDRVLHGRRCRFRCVSIEQRQTPRPVAVAARVRVWQQRPDGSVSDGRVDRSARCSADVPGMAAGSVRSPDDLGWGCPRCCLA